MRVIVLICLTVAVTTVVVHQEGLTAIARLARRVEGRHSRAMVLGVIFGILGLHLLEIGIYSAAYDAAADLFHLGRLVGDVEGTDLEYFYFSAETFTTLGFGDIVPEGPMRLLASFEPLNGLILV